MKKDAIYAKPHEEGMAIYVTHANEEYFVMTHRRNSGLFHYLEDGRSTGEVKSFRPGRNKYEQKLCKSLNHIVKITDYVLQEAA